jgi:hypothetical protein
MNVEESLNYLFGPNMRKAENTGQDSEAHLLRTAAAKLYGAKEVKKLFGLVISPLLKIIANDTNAGVRDAAILLLIAFKAHSIAVMKGLINATGRKSETLNADFRT